MDKVLNQRLVLGVTGGIAAYKVAELARLLIRNNVDIQVAMTEAATRFVTPVTFQALSGRPVVTDLWDASYANNMAHIELSRGAQAILVAPASADFIAKLAHGLADDALSCIALALNPAAKLIIAPAMNGKMWQHPATQQNLATLKSRGADIVGPDAGMLSCGYEGVGRLETVDELVKRVLGL